MDTIFWLPVVAVGIGIALWFIASHRKDRSSSPPVPKSRTSPAVDTLDRTPAGAVRRMPPMGANFEAVSIQIAYHPCQAAREARGKRFLPEEMPDLPLPECDRKCHCTFVYHRERRDEENRRAPYLTVDGDAQDFDVQEQRSEADRRKK